MGKKVTGPKFLLLGAGSGGKASTLNSCVFSFPRYSENSELNASKEEVFSHSACDWQQQA